MADAQIQLQVQVPQPSPQQPVLQSNHAPRIPVGLQAVFLASNQGEVVDKPPENGEAFKVFIRPNNKYSQLNPFRGVFRRGGNGAAIKRSTTNHGTFAATEGNDTTGTVLDNSTRSNRLAEVVGGNVGNDSNKDLTYRSRLFFSRRTRRRDESNIPLPSSEYNRLQKQQFQMEQRQQQQQQPQNYEHSHVVKPSTEVLGISSSSHYRIATKKNLDFGSSHHRQGFLKSNTEHNRNFQIYEKDYIHDDGHNQKKKNISGTFRSLRDRLNVFKIRTSSTRGFDNRRHDSIAGREFYFGTGGDDVQGDNSFSGVTGTTTTIDHSLLHQQLQRQYAIDVEDISTSSPNLDDSDFNSHHSRALLARNIPSSDVSAPGSHAVLHKKKRVSSSLPVPFVPDSSVAESSGMLHTSIHKKKDVSEHSNYSRTDSTTAKKRKSKRNPSITPSTTGIPKGSSHASDRSLQGFFDRLISARGYATETYPTLETGYHNDSTPLQEASYTSYTVAAAKNGDSSNVRRLLKCGLSPNPANYYGESLLHIVCRSGSHEMLQIMLECGATVQVSDDVGRTPLHSACWAKVPAFAVVEMLLQRDVFLMHLRDARGSTPLEYVRKEHWPAWISFFLAKKNKYWPVRVPEIVGRQQVPVLIRIPPNSVPVLDAPNALNLALARMVAKGTMEPEDAMLLQSGELGDEDDDIDEEDEDSDDDDDDDESDSDESSYGGSYGSKRFKANNNTKREEKVAVVEPIPIQKKKDRNASAAMSASNSSIDIDETRFFSSKDSIYGDNNSSNTSMLRNLMMFDDEDEDDMLLDEMLRRVASSKQNTQRENKKGKR